MGQINLLLFFFSCLKQSCESITILGYLNPSATLSHAQTPGYLSALALQEEILDVLHCLQSCCLFAELKGGCIKGRCVAQCRHFTYSS